MKAIAQDRYGPVDVLEVREVDRPASADDQVLVRVRAAGLHPGDWHMMTGTPYAMRLVTGLRGPRMKIRGFDVAGHVEAVGRNVTRFQPGDEVFGWGTGTFAEYAAIPEKNLAPKPERLTFEQAAAVPTSAITALQAVRNRGQVGPGQRVLVIGAGGGIGSFAVQIAKADGAEVTGVCSTGKVELVRSIGADHVIDYTKEDFAAQGPRYDVILDIAGNRSLSHLRRALAPKGTLVFVGGEGGGPLVGDVMARGMKARVMSPFIGQRLRPLLALNRQRDLVTLAGLIEAGKVTPVIDRTYPLDKTPDAVRYLQGWHAKGKIVITV
jgi:NADPH:quinone reductase-like Zn-dependent oxidoreductase